MNPAISVVLPIHNQERSLSSLVWSVLDVADSMQKSVRLILVDDGSTDDSFDVACEISRTVPQVEVLRQASRLGLQAAVERVRRETGVASAIVHDGASPVDLGELAAMLNESPVEGSPSVAPAMAADDHWRGSRRFASIRALNERMQEAHGAISAFRWMGVGVGQSPRRMSTTHTAAAPPLRDASGDNASAANSPMAAE